MELYFQMVLVPCHFKLVIISSCLHDAGFIVQITFLYCSFRKAIFGAEVLASGLLSNWNYWRKFFHWVWLIKTLFPPLPGTKPVLISAPRLRPLDPEEMGSVSLRKAAESLRFGGEQGHSRKGLSCYWGDVEEYAYEKQVRKLTRHAWVGNSVVWSIPRVIWQCKKKNYQTQVI